MRILHAPRRSSRSNRLEAAALDEARRTIFPAALPREEVTPAGPMSACPDCGGALHSIGVTTSEMLDWVPASLRVIRIHSTKVRRCRVCGTIHQAAAPERLIAKGMATTGLVAQVLVSKYCDHTPLYRQAQIFARQGVDLDRSTLRPTGSAVLVGGWKRSTRGSPPISSPPPSSSLTIRRFLCSIPAVAGPRRAGYGRMRATIDPGQDPIRRPRSTSTVPDRKAGTTRFASERLQRGPPGRRAGFERLTASGTVVLAACWAHARRKFFELHEATGSPIAAEALRRIAELYAIEEGIRGQSAQHRRLVRSREARPLVMAMKPWFEQELGRIPPHSTLAEAIRYALGRWPALCRFLDDGRIELDNNAVERAIRPIALGRKNHLFAGSGRRWSPLAGGRLAHRFGQTQWHRALCLPQRRPRPHEQGPSRKPAGRAAALELARTAAADATPYLGASTRRLPREIA